MAMDTVKFLRRKVRESRRLKATTVCRQARHQIAQTYWHSIAVFRLQHLRLFGLITDEHLDDLGFFFEKRVLGLPEQTSHEAMRKVAMEPPLSLVVKEAIWKSLKKIVYS